MSWQTHAATFCKELNLCDGTVGGEYWGANNADPRLIVQVGDHIKAKHGTLDDMGAGMLVAFMAASARIVLCERSFTTEEECAMLATIRVVCDRPKLDSYVAYFIDENDPQDPLMLWITTRLAPWRPRPWPQS